MIHHFNCAYRMPHINDPLIFDWDDETGEITGPSADEILVEFRKGTTMTHPIPSSCALTSTKNKTDLAAVVGYSHVLPPELADHYPQCENADWDGAVYDMDGNVVGHVVF